LTLVENLLYSNPINEFPGFGAYGVDHDMSDERKTPRYLKFST